MPHAVFLMKIRYCFQPRNQKQNCFELIGWAGLSSAACFAMQMRAFSILEKPYIFVLAVVVVLSQEAALDAGNGAFSSPY